MDPNRYLDAQVDWETFFFAAAAVAAVMSCVSIIALVS